MGFFSSIGNFFKDTAEDVLSVVGEVAGVAAPVVGGIFLGPQGGQLGAKLAQTFNQVVDRVFEEPTPTAPLVTPVTQQPSLKGQQLAVAGAVPVVAPGAGLFGGGMTPILLIGGAALVALLVLK